MLFVNTRPTIRAQALSQCLSQAGITVFELPLLALQAQPYTENLQQQFQQLEHVQAVVVVSPTAVEIGMQYLRRSQLEMSALAQIQWIAVGQKTADALAQYGITASVPEVETSEGMLDLPIFSQRQDLKKIAFWRGIGGRQFMMQQCQQQGIEVLNILLYQRQCPDEAKPQFNTLIHQYALDPKPYIVCISSEASWHYWCQLCEKHLEFLQQGHYLVLGERLYHILQKFTLKKGICFNITQLDSLDESTVLNTLQQLHI